MSVRIYKMWVLEADFSLIIWKKFCLVKTVFCHIWEQCCMSSSLNWKPKWKRSPEPPLPCIWCYNKQVKNWHTHCRTSAWWMSLSWLHWKYQAGFWKWKPEWSFQRPGMPGMAGHNTKQWLNPCCNQRWYGHALIMLQYQQREEELLTRLHIS